jgi:hypothetical protein
MADASAPDDTLRYDDIRKGIDDGDVILFRGTVTTSRIIEAVTQGAYSHSALAVWWGDRLMLCQAGGSGVEAVPMSVALATYAGAVDWYKLHPEARALVDMAALLGEAKADLGLPYSHMSLVREGAHRLFGTSLPPEEASPSGLVCSQYVSRCFRKAGLPLCDKADLDTAPTDIATSSVLELIGTIVADPQDAR